MFFFLKKKPSVVTLITTDEAVFKYARPERAAKFIPPWFKTLPKNIFSNDQLAPKATLRSCPGFIDLYKSGFIVPSWSDFNLEIGADYYRYEFADRKSEIQNHPIDQIRDSHFYETHLIGKLMSPWWAKSNKPIKLLLTAPVWNNFGADDMCVVPGVLSLHDFFMDTNINMLLKKQPEAKVYTIKFGQPLCHLIPLADSPVELHYELVTQEEWRRISTTHPVNFFFFDRLRRSAKLCPHAK